MKNKLKWALPGLAIIILFLIMWPVLTKEELEILVPVRIEKMPPGLALAQKSLKGIEVRLSGPAALMKTIQKQKLTYPLDLSGMGTGLQRLEVKKDLIKLPKNISIVSFTPTALTFILENQIKKLIPVVIDFTGKPAKGFSVTTAMVKPPMANLSGPMHLLTPLDHIKTKPVDLGGLSKSFKKETTLALYENIVMHSPPKTFVVEVSIQEDVISKTFENIPVVGKGTPHKYKITPPAISIQVKGPAVFLEKLDTQKDINVHVDLKGLKPGVYARRAVINLPAPIILSGATPEVFTAEIGDRQSKEK